MKSLSLFKRMKKVLEGQSGMALPAVLLVMVVLVILGVAILSTTLAEANFAVEQNQKMQAHYLGRSGVLVGYEKLKDMTQDPFDFGYDGTIEDLRFELNDWVATNINDMKMDDENKFDLKFELINNNEFKIISEGRVEGNRTTRDVVSLRVQMLSSIISSGRATDWYKNPNASNLDNNTSVATNYLGQYVTMIGNGDHVSKAPPNVGDSVFQASIIQFQKEKSGTRCLDYPGNTAALTFDAEIIVFDGDIEMAGAVGNRPDMMLTLSKAVALDKLDSSKDPTSVLYVTDSNAVDELDDFPDGVGFENADYHAYFTGETFADYGLYDFDPVRYGVVYFGGDLKYGSSSDSVSGYYYFPSGVLLNKRENPDTPELDLNDLIEIIPGDPIVDRIQVINRVTINLSAPYMWDKK